MAAKELAIKQTIDKIVSFMAFKEYNQVINDWLSGDQESLDLVVYLLHLCWENGWTKFDEPISNYETDEISMLCEEIFNRAMAHFKKGVKKYA